MTFSVVRASGQTWKKLPRNPRTREPLLEGGDFDLVTTKYVAIKASSTSSTTYWIKNLQYLLQTILYIITHIYIYILFIYDSRGKIGRTNFWKLKSSSAFATYVPRHFFEQCSDDAHEIQESLPASRCQPSSSSSSSSPQSSSSSWWSWVVATRQGFHSIRLLGHATGTQCQKICPDGKNIFLSKTFSWPNKTWKINYPQNRSFTQVGSAQLLYTENLKISENRIQPIVETARLCDICRSTPDTIPPQALPWASPIPGSSLGTVLAHRWRPQQTGPRYGHWPGHLLCNTGLSENHGKPHWNPKFWYW